MWVSTNKQYENSLMFFQFLRKNDLCIFNFTNMKKSYSKEIQESSIASLYSTTNYMIEVEATDVIEFLLKESNNVHFNFYPEQLDIRAEIIINLTEGFSPLILTLELDLWDSNHFYTNLTCPLLQIIQLLKKNQEDLFELLKKKDLEIAEYVLEGGNITNKNIKTETFKKENFIINALQKNNNSCDGSPNLFEIYSSPLIELSNHRCLHVRELLNTVVKQDQKVENKEISLKKKHYDQATSSTQIEITDALINVKKKKTSLLKNL